MLPRCGRRRNPRPLLVGAALMTLVLAGCGGGEEDLPATSSVRPASEASSEQRAPRAPAPPPCPAAAANCERAAGRIVYVERIDPDGDGDAHFVLISDESITAPGITVVDVEAELRPSPLPAPGDLIAASGPVCRGSYGQRQIEADAIRVRYDERRDTDRSP